MHCLPRSVLYTVALIASACNDATSNVPPDILDDPVGRQLVWTLSVINEREELPYAEIQAHFSPYFLSMTPVADTAALLERQGHHLAPLTVDGILRMRGSQVAFVGESRLGPVSIDLHVDQETKRISTLYIRPYLNGSLAEVLRRLPTIAPHAQLVVAEIEDGMCLPIITYHGDIVHQIASTSKLYVLLALVDAIVAGEYSWDSPLAVRDAWKSAQPSTIFDMPSGTTLSLQTFAEVLIAESDNSANDHLVHALGRRRIEEAVRASGHSDSRRNTPYLTFREFFYLRRQESGEVDRYLALSESERRRYLDQIQHKTSTHAMTDGFHLEKVGVFASALDVCELLAKLHDRSEVYPEAEPVLDILAPVARRRASAYTRRPVWPYIGGKGGSTYGVYSNSWLLQRDDDRWFAVVVGYYGEHLGALEKHMAAAIEARLIDLLDTFDR